MRRPKWLRALAAGALSLALLLGSAAPALAWTETDQFVSSGHGYISPSYLVVHSTANPGATAKNHISYWRNNQPNVEMAHWVMDWTNGGTVIQAQASNRKAWHVGNGNSYCIGIELCEATNAKDFALEYDQAARWCAFVLAQRGWGIDRLISHNEARLKWGGTHTDPGPYFARYGKSWSDFERLVSKYMASGDYQEGEAGTAPSAPSKPASTGLGDLRYWGPKYTLELQDQLGTEEDGVVSRQYTGNRRYMMNDDLSSWSYGRTVSKTGYRGSQCIKQLQTELKDLGYYRGAIDGLCGRQTVTALQLWLEDQGYDVGSWGCNGYFGGDTSTAMGHALQNDEFVDMAA